MFKLVYASDYTTYTAGVYPDLEACVDDCKKRYGGDLKFGQDDAGTLYTILYADGVVILRLYEVSQGVAV